MVPAPLARGPTPTRGSPRPGLREPPGRGAGVPTGPRQRHTGGVPTTLEPTEVIEPSVDDDTATDRPWVVLVWNDPVNLMSYVTYVFQKLFGYSLEKATELMLDVHNKGRAVVASCGREEAEMHVFRLHEHSLWATMEHDGPSS
jgi:ATP-dependent Clp protease adaptor protein ClpS